ncbi:MAG: hypothetical protein ABIK09_18425 [Pseudomonadota bacterium]
MKQESGHRWWDGLMVIAVLAAFGCSGTGETTTLEDALVPEDTADLDASDVAEEISIDTFSDAAPDTAPDTDAGLTCPPEVDPCVPCETDEDCEGVFEDLGTCEVEICSAEFGACVPEMVEEGTACSDEDPCNGLETCAEVDGEATCVAGLPLECDDGEPCNGDETCVAGAGCQEGVPLECGDGDLCNGDETCVAGEGCQEGEALQCDDGDPCNGDEGCDPVAGCLLGKALECDDGDLCDGAETCVAQVGCQEGEPLDCDDGNPCTDDACAPAGGCTHLPNTMPGCCEIDADCDDDNPCTTDLCTSETQACAHGFAVGSCTDGDPCTVGDVCAAGACASGATLPDCVVLCELSGGAGEVVTCDIGLARRTQADEAPAVAHFHVQYDAEAAALATFVDQVCLGPTECISVNIPEVGTSLGETGHTVYIFPEEPAAWDGDCGLSIEHVVDAAIPLSAAWYDALEILQGDAHLLGVSFILSEDIATADAVPVLLYDIGASSVTKAPLAVATVGGIIVTADEACGATAMHCFDGFPCTEDVCDPGPASCTHPVQTGECDDGNQCTEGDHCDAVGDCVPQTPADGGTECFGADLCVEIGTCDGAGTCDVNPDLAVDCPEAPSDCATYQCDPANGGCALLVYAPGVGCDDGDPCTGSDHCNGSGACIGAAADCSDGFDCTVDSCDPGNGACIHAPDDLACDDENTCTDDVCDLAAGCLVTPAAGSCDDLDPCTDDDACDDGSCVGVWDPADCGCDVAADCALLDDGNPCTGTWACVGGTCQINPSTVVQCPAYAGDCQQWACNPDTGTCVSQDAVVGTPCEPGPCMFDAACGGGGQCVGVPVSCDDGDDCTEDSCDPASGCVNEADPECGSTFCICEVSGAAGATVDCPLSVVRSSEAGDSPTGADFQLSWDNTKMALTTFVDDLCYGSICLPKIIPTCSGQGTGCVWGSLYPTGHSIVAVPKELAAWIEQGTLLFFHPSDPFKRITDAWLSGGAISGEPQFLLARVTLTEEIDPAEPVCLYMNDPVFSVPSGLTLDITVQEIGGARIIVVE